MHPERLFASFYHGFSGLSRGFGKKSGKREIFSAGWCKNGNRVTQNGCFFPLAVPDGILHRGTRGSPHYRKARLRRESRQRFSAERGGESSERRSTPATVFVRKRRRASPVRLFFEDFTEIAAPRLWRTETAGRRPHVFSVAECAGGGGRQAHPDKAVLLLRKTSEKCCFRRDFIRP